MSYYEQETLGYFFASGKFDRTPETQQVSLEKKATVEASDWPARVHASMLLAGLGGSFVRRRCCCLYDVIGNFIPFFKFI